MFGVFLTIRCYYILYTEPMYQVTELLKFPKLFHAFSTKSEGNMSYFFNGNECDKDQVLENRNKFLAKFDIDINSCIALWVEHSDKILVADRKSAGISMKDKKYAIRADGLITNQKGLYLFLLIADCLPIILYDPVRGAIGLVHAGWLGVDLEIAKKGVMEMQEKYRCNPSDMVVGIGPCAHKESFIKENPSQKDDPRWQPFMQKTEGELYKVDLVGFTKKQLLDAGVQDKNLFISNVDTAKDKRFFSHTREKDLPIERQGRFACVVGLRGR